MKWFKFVIFIAFNLSGFGCFPPSGVAKFDEDSFRLPGHTRPINYDIELAFNIHNGSLPYVGKVVITIVVDVATDVITLHNKGLTVAEVKVIDKDKELLGNDFVVETARDFLFVNVDKTLNVGDNYTLEISFNGRISTANNGIFRTSYRNVESNEIR